MANAVQLVEQLKRGDFDNALCRLYGEDPNVLSKQRERYAKAVEEFEKHFDGTRELRLYSAPGRTEIGGNHTDHNHGVVMAAAVDLDMVAVVAQNNSTQVNIYSQNFERTDSVDVSCLAPQEEEKGSSPSLIRGIAARIVELGGTVGGFDAYTTSDVLRGSGLSSSAAFEVLVGEIFNAEFNDGRFSAVDNAKIGQYAENVFFDKPCGLMDQTACAVGSAITIDFKEPASPVVDKIPFDIAKHGFCLCITDTKGSHADLTDDYAAIRREMESVAEFLGKKVLRDVDEEVFFSKIAEIREKLGDRAVLRAIHFFADCKRAKALYEAVADDRFDDFLHLIVDGGHSSFEYNQNAYSIKKPEEQGVALGVALSQRVLADRGAWRLQGGGFAGTIQAFVPKDLLEQYRATLEGVFGKGSCYVLNVRNYGAIQVTQDL